MLVGRLFTTIDQLTQLVQNLVSNALKFVAPGAVPTVHLSIDDQEDDMVTICIEDNGIGMENKHVERVFEIFKRLHTREQYPGTGIGLAICRKIVARHGGKIWVESRVGGGSSFKFTLKSMGGGEAMHPG